MLFMADVMSLVVLTAVVVAAIRRIFFRPPHIEASFEAFFILSLVATLMIAYFGLNACEIRLSEENMVSWTPISYAIFTVFANASAETVHIWARIFWWIHALVLLFFLNFLPYSKHLHILTAIPNCFFKSFTFVKTLPRMTFKRGQRFGISKIIQFTWKDLFDFLSCTECGRCARACPATCTGKPLNPMEVIHEGKRNLMANGNKILAARPADTIASAPEDSQMAVPLINGGENNIATDAIWACTTCGACMQKCPVFIEHVPKLLWMRRHLVMEKASFPEELIAFFETPSSGSIPGASPPQIATSGYRIEIQKYCLTAPMLNTCSLSAALARLIRATARSPSR